MQHKLEVRRSVEGRWLWRLHGANGRVVALGCPDGYENKADAANAARELLAGEFDLVFDDQLVSLGRAH